MNKLLDFDIGTFFKDMFTFFYNTFDFTLIIFGEQVKFYYILLFCIIIGIILKVIYIVMDILD